MIALVLAAAALASTASVCIDPGHGGSDPGAVGNGMEEADLNLGAGLALRDWLDLDTRDGRGGGTWDTLMTRDTDVYVSLAARTDLANAAGVDLFTAIHTNAGGGDGTETYAWASGTESDDLAHLVQEEMVSTMGTRDRGVKYAEFYVITYTDMPATLAEMAFIDTWAGNAQLLQDPATLDAVGLAHLHALQRHAGLSPYTPSEGGAGDPWAELTVESWPEAAAAGARMEIGVRWRTNLYDLGDEAELGLRLVDGESWDVLDTAVWSPPGGQGSHDFALDAPSTQGEVFFVAWIAPRGEGWSERLSEASTAAGPTRITGDDPSADWIEVAQYPHEIVREGRFGVRIDHDAAWEGELSVELVEGPSGQVAQTLTVPLNDRGRQDVELRYDGPAESVWIHACAGPAGDPCYLEDDTEDDPIAVMDRAGEESPGGCGCHHPAAGWLALLPLLALTRRRR